MECDPRIGASAARDPLGAAVGLMPVCGNGMSATANDILREGAEFSKMNQDTFQLAADSRVYDDRYETNYRQRVDGLEVARWNALAHFIRMVACPVWGGRVLDYGAG